MEDSRTALLKKIQMCEFALNEANLYLDTHPNCSDALDYFKKHKETKKKYMDEYVRKYGPLYAGQYDGGNTWQWVQNPWPWERTGA